MENCRESDTSLQDKIRRELYLGMWKSYKEFIFAPLGKDHGLLSFRKTVGFSINVSEQGGVMVSQTTNGLSGLLLVYSASIYSVLFQRLNSVIRQYCGEIL